MEKTEINGGNPNLNGNGNHSSGDSKVALNGKSNEMPTFINHAEIAWHERRKEWVGDRSENVQREPKEPILSWTMTYEDLLTAEPFQQPIPLAEMVDFLVDIWHEDGLYD
ncbi:uncharacterized protein E5676_scaffold352G002770 [Cucumis melo var. makuwa]|uniref:Uncharacterized protein LOC103486506 isoform X1 n=2 Tax=Cucumis melo TaxID=3656 RepID=A0A1S3B705_CUCME|nr:uncharacterized protein LOC103486506 isoform X1 [Cucumis melo]XP_008442714.1 uncharacterized protein LOC103486506 isoform X1 [Cucumis melo]KAA0043988.1 uncharacterized protein E6C27_scaffold236G003340 [Cucumis melo var. makuwa]TYK25152.1 uncharacterized protein E5676_scaffold352G002770 [Cucumis melo var. makuwa]